MEDRVDSLTLGDEFAVNWMSMKRRSSISLRECVNVVVSVNVIGWRHTCCVRFTHPGCYIFCYFTKTMLYFEK